MKPDNILLSAVDSKRVDKLGHGALLETENLAVSIEDLYVVEKLQRRKIGTRPIGTAIKHFKNRGFNSTQVQITTIQVIKSI